MYFNTTNETGATLKASETKAEYQERRILALFNDEVVMTRHEVYQALNSPDTPEASVCRALRVLVKDNKLVKLPFTVRGIYGKQVHQWCNKEYYESNYDSELLFHECPNCNSRCNCTSQPCNCCLENKF